MSAAQWVWIISLGLFVNTNFMYSEAIQQVLTTVLSMTAGTIVSVFVRKYLVRLIAWWDIRKRIKRKK